MHPSTTMNIISTLLFSGYFCCHYYYCIFLLLLFKTFRAGDQILFIYSKTGLKRPLSKRPKVVFQDSSLYTGQKYCRMLQGEHSAILSTCIKLYHMALRPLFLLFLNGRFKQVSLYGYHYFWVNIIVGQVMGSTITLRIM